MRNKLLVAALVVVGMASIAYASFAQDLVISGKGTVSGDWDVAITSITPKNQVGATDKTDTPTFSDTTASFDVSLAYPGATSTYDIVITNRGNVPAKLSTITDDIAAKNLVAPTDVKFTLTGPAVDSTLAPEATVTATLKAEWLGSATANATNESKSVTITYNYIQNT